MARRKVKINALDAGAGGGGAAGVCGGAGEREGGDGAGVLLPKVPSVQFPARPRSRAREEELQLGQLRTRRRRERDMAPRGQRNFLILI